MRSLINTRRARIERSPNATGAIFQNLTPIDMLVPGSFPRMLWHQLTGREQRYPPGPLPLAWPGPTAHATPPTSGLRITWLGHSTLLVELGKTVILTDPVWAQRASPLPFVGPRRFHPPPIPWTALPPPDLVLLSHDHYDHLDKQVIRSLARASVPFVTSLGVGQQLERWGIAPSRIHELDWWDDLALPELGLTLTAVPAQHFSGRGLRRNTTLWSSWVVRSANHNLYVGGDSGFFVGFAEIGKRYGPFDLASLDTAQYDPTWHAVHMNPEEAVEASLALGARMLLPVHWGTFSLAFHAWDEPIERLLACADQRQVVVVAPRLGEPFEPTLVAPRDPWWRGVHP